MKNKVKFSSLSKFLTATVLIVLCVGFFAELSRDTLLVYSIIVFGTIFSGLYYCPVSVEADTSGIVLHRLMSKSKRFPYKDIKLIETCYPSDGGIRLCGSGGWFGYWGYFNDIMYGTYFGYYGDRNHCFIVELKNGKKYILGCDNQVAFVNYVKSQLNN